MSTHFWAPVIKVWMFLCENTSYSQNVPNGLRSFIEIIRMCHTPNKLQNAFYHRVWGGPNCFYAWEIHKNRKMKLNVQGVWQIYWYRYNISDHSISTWNASNELEMYSPSHFGPKRSPNTFRLEHSLVRNRPLNLEDIWCTVKIASKTSFSTRFLKICMEAENVTSDHFWGL